MSPIGSDGSWFSLLVPNDGSMTGAERNGDLSRAVAIAATIGVAVALLRMPYGYYMLLRFGLCAASVFYIVRQLKVRFSGVVVVLVGLVVLYNPVWPVHLGRKELWTLINIGTVALFWMLVSRPTIGGKERAG